jgi:hypothetical protein
MRRRVRPGLAHAGVAVRGPVAHGREGPALVAGSVCFAFIRCASFTGTYVSRIAQ